MAQDGPKMGPRGPQDGPQDGPKTAPRRLQVVSYRNLFLSIFAFLAITCPKPPETAVGPRQDPPGDLSGTPPGPPRDALGTRSGPLWDNFRDLPELSCKHWSKQVVRITRLVYNKRSRGIGGGR